MSFAHDQIKERFQKMGARVRVAVFSGPRSARAWNGGRRQRSPRSFPIRVDVRRDEMGEYFDVQHRRDIDVEVLDVQPNDRHLVLAARGHVTIDNKNRSVRSTFLCGHDERAWFVAAVPEDARVETVRDAKDALKPQAVWEAMREYRVPHARRSQRRTRAFVRQGEWFFIPRPAFQMDARFALRNEPIRRGAGKPHWCQFLYRFGGDEVYVNDSYPNGLTDAQFAKLPRHQQQGGDWRKMFRDARVYVKGRVSHPDHATITLPYWHEVVMNTETQAAAMQHVAFLD